MTWRDLPPDYLADAYTREGHRLVASLDEADDPPTLLEQRNMQRRANRTPREVLADENHSRAVWGLPPLTSLKDVA